MYLRQLGASVLTIIFCLVSSGPGSAQTKRSGPTTAPANELDAFMEKVLARREVNRKTLEQYILDETEQFEILGPGRWPLHRGRRDYTWYVRDGMHVRSPVRVNGVTVGEESRRRYETSWIQRERARQERKARKEKEEKENGGKVESESKAAQGDKGAAERGKANDGGEIAVTPEGIQVSGTVVPTEPRFVSEAYFMDFKFEPGNYYLAGREQLDGHDVLKIEYYPTKMFGDSDDERKERGREKDQNRRGDREARRAEEDIGRRMNKTALITLWVDPKEHQIVKYTFDNVWLDFLPAAWLVRVDDIRASMVMGQPFPGVWLPRDIGIHAGVTLASGSFEASYDRTFSDYRLADVEIRMRVPKESSRRGSDLDFRDRGVRSRYFAPNPSPFGRSQRRGVGPRFRTFGLRRTAGSDLGSRSLPQKGFRRSRSDPGRQAQPGGGQAQEVIGEIRIHGNAFLTDKEVLDLAGVAVGQPLDPGGVDAIARRLNDSDRFEAIDVRKRYRSLTSTTDIALVLVVHEKPGVRSAVGGVAIPGIPSTIARPAGRLRSKLMFLPIVNFADGYGFTYGGRMSTIDLLGIDERLSVPLTWGGTRRAALEFERVFKTGPLTRVESSIAIWNRENPRFDIRDQRVEVNGRAERVFRDLVRVGVDASRSTISFADLDDRLWSLGTSVALDTRLDPAFPGNAVFLGASWTGLHFRAVADPVNRYSGDARGYLRVFRQVVVAGRAQYAGADASLPPYERLLLGGSSSLRGFRAGSFDGDRTFVTSAEVRVPITSVLRGAKLGVTAFVDAARVWDAGGRFEDAEWHRGAGAGVFLIASIVRINVDVARGLKTGSTRLHLSSGFSF